MEKMIAALIADKGPLTGQEVREATGEEELLLWRTCKTSQEISMRLIGTRYLRFDRRIEGFARLSPSILREFLTYSVIGLKRDSVSIARKAQRILEHIEGISRAKSQLAYNVVSSLADRLESEEPVMDRIIFILGGDIVYNMAHDVPRPERSTGKPVNGSDIDIVVIADDPVPKSLLGRLDEAIFEEKYRFLMTPHLREEIDYVVKDLDRVREQVRFDTFKRMVACKILHEGTLIYGSEELFGRMKALLKDHGVAAKLTALEGRARAFRNRAEETLLREDVENIKAGLLDLFFPAEESEEFE